MSGLPAPSPLSSGWPQMSGPPGGGPLTSGLAPLGANNPSGLPSINNPNLPSTTMPNTGNFPPPSTPFPRIQQPFGGMNGVNTNNYGLPPNFPYNPAASNLQVPNPAQVIQNAANQRRLMQLEDENTQRRNTTSTLQQMGTHLLQDQMFVQEQVLQYQYMLEQCLETLDHQNLVLNGQAEELALLRAKLRTFESFMDTIKHSQETNQLGKSSSIDSQFLDGSFMCSRNLLKSLDAPPGSPFSPGGVARITSSKFQPFNPRYRSPNSRSANQNASRSATPSVPPNSSTTNTTRPSRYTNNFRN